MYLTAGQPSLPGGCPSPHSSLLDGCKSQAHTFASTHKYFSIPYSASLQTVFYRLLFLLNRCAFQSPFFPCHSLATQPIHCKSQYHRHNHTVNSKSPLLFLSSPEALQTHDCHIAQEDTAKTITKRTWSTEKLQKDLHTKQTKDKKARRTLINTSHCGAFQNKSPIQRWESQCGPLPLSLKAMQGWRTVN